MPPCWMLNLLLNMFFLKTYCSSLICLLLLVAYQLTLCNKTQEYEDLFFLLIFISQCKM